VDLISRGREGKASGGEREGRGMGREEGREREGDRGNGRDGEDMG